SAEDRSKRCLTRTCSLCFASTRLCTSGSALPGYVTWRRQSRDGLASMGRQLRGEPAHQVRCACCSPALSYQNDSWESDHRGSLPHHRENDPQRSNLSTKWSAMPSARKTLCPLDATSSG